METDIAELKKELKLIRKNLEEIKESIPDKEMFLTVEEHQLLYESFENERKGSLKSSKDLRRELEE